MPGVPLQETLIFFLGALSLGFSGGLLGTFLVWHRLSYVADAFAHAAIFGAALALFLALPPFVALTLFALMFAAFFAFAMDGRAFDAWVMILSAGAMSLGLLWMVLMGQPTKNVLSYLLGGFFESSTLHSLGCVFFALIVSVFAWRYWRVLVLRTLSRDLALMGGAVFSRIIFFVWLCLVLFFLVLGLRHAGALVLTLLLVGPLAVAHKWAISPVQCFLASGIVGATVFTVAVLCSELTGLQLGPILGVLWVLVLGLSFGVWWIVKPAPSGRFKRIFRKDVKKDAL